MIRHFLQERLFIAMLISLGLIAATGVFRKRDVTGIDPERYWVSKTQWEAVADCVLTGSSRVYRGLSPDDMAPHLDNRRILNYGFSGNAYTNDYLDAIEKVLDPKSDRLMVVLGIDPYSLTRNAARDNGFIYQKKASAAQPAIKLYMKELVSFLDPVPVGQVSDDLFPSENGPHYFQEYFSNGWVASTRVPETVRSAARIYTRQFRENPLDPVMLENLFRRVYAWTKRGISVYALRPPTCQATIEIEYHRCGFDQAAFTDALEAAGGNWVTLNQVGYHTYDGSHLRREDAIQLSVDAARQIAGIEARKKAANPHLITETQFDEKLKGMVARLIGEPANVTGQASKTENDAAPEFHTIAFHDSPEQHRSRWNYRSKRISITAEQDEGLRCDIECSAEVERGCYGGIKFDATAPQALQLDLTLLNPDGIKGLYVDGYDDSKTRVARWEWEPYVTGIPENLRQTYLLEPNRPTRYFAQLDDVNMAAIRQVHVFAWTNKGTKSGFVLHKAQMAWPKTNVSNMKSTTVSLGGPEKFYKSQWKYRSKAVNIVSEDGGLRCEVIGSPEKSGAQYGGLKFPVKSARILQLDMSLLNPENINEIFVQGYDFKGRTCVRWRWQTSKVAIRSPQRHEYTLVPGKQSGPFAPLDKADLAAARQIHVFVSIKPETEAGFVLHRAEINN